MEPYPVYGLPERPEVPEVLEVLPSLRRETVVVRRVRRFYRLPEDVDPAVPRTALQELVLVSERSETTSDVSPLRVCTLVSSLLPGVDCGRP